MISSILSVEWSAKKGDKKLMKSNSKKICDFSGQSHNVHYNVYYWHKDT